MRHRLLPAALLLAGFSAFAGMPAHAQEPTNGNLRPVVSWVTPMSTPTATVANGSVMFEVNANDPDGSISQVLFWYPDAQGRSRILAVVTKAPYRFTWWYAPNGVYTVRALAIDNKNLGMNSTPMDVYIGQPPSITSFSAAQSYVATGASTTLTWGTAGATSVSIEGMGPQTGTSLVVTPSATTTYKLTATNPTGTVSATVTVNVGQPPAINSLAFAPDGVVIGTNTTVLKWNVTGATTLSIDQGVGVVTGTQTAITPNAPTGTTKTYVLTASNAFGTVTRSADVTIGLPAIPTFTTNQPTTTTFSPATFTWTTTGAKSVTLAPAGGTAVSVALNGSTSVAPTASTAVTYLLTATNSVGTTTKTLRIQQMPGLVKLTDSLYYSEHAFFIIPAAGQVNWAASSYADVYSKTNRDAFVATLNQYFPDDYMYVPLTMSNPQPAQAPSALTFRHLAYGIGDNAITGVGVPNFVRYTTQGTFLPSSYGVLNHEAGHNWGVRIGSEVGVGHWLSNSTVGGQMADTYTDDGYLTDKLIFGNPAQGFTWQAQNHINRQKTQTYADQDLYLMGLAAAFPTVYVLKSPVYNPNGTMSYASVNAYDQAWLEAKNGVRSPDYRMSPKRFRMAFVYVARDLTEVLSQAPNVEDSASQWSESDVIDTVRYPLQVPFLAATKFRATFNARLADLDGNATPSLTLGGTGYFDSADGTVTVPYTAIDPDGAAPTVTCVQPDAPCTVANGAISVSGLSSGAHFFTVKAQDAGGKRVYAHFVVDVQ